MRNLCFRILAFLLVCACQACSTQAQNHASDTGAETMVYFYANRDGNTDIYQRSFSDETLIPLTQDTGYDDSPAVSPDGKQVVFLSARDDPDPHFPDLKYEIYLLTLDGMQLTRLTQTPYAEDHPAWSPDGKELLYDADADGDGYYEIYRMNLESGQTERLTHNAANDQFADWSPDGKQIAFSSDRQGNWDIFIMDADGANQRALTDAPAWELFPAWSPDGKQIAYNGLAPRSRNTDVYLMLADGSSSRQLTDAPGFDENPAWTADGSRICFQSNRDGNFNLYCMAPDGSSQIAITNTTYDELWPSFPLTLP